MLTFQDQIENFEITILQDMLTYLLTHVSFDFDHLPSSGNSYISTGEVKRHGEQFGFIDSEPAKARFGRDVYFSPKSVSAEVFRLCAGLRTHDLEVLCRLRRI